MISKQKKISFFVASCLRVGCILFIFLLVQSVWAKPRIVLDAAHGGNDSGVKSGREVEKDWNTKIAQALQKAFEEKGFEVVVVRKGDTAVTEEKRSELINTSQASAAIILHADREFTGEQKGPCLVIEPPSKADQAETGESQKWGFISLSQYHASLKLARTIAQNLGMEPAFSALSDSRGLGGETPSAEGGIYCLPHQSLRYLTLPSVVLTPLFLSSASDIKKFSNADYLSGFAEKVVRGTSEYLQLAP